MEYVKIKYCPVCFYVFKQDYNICKYCNNKPQIKYVKKYL